MKYDGSDPNPFSSPTVTGAVPSVSAPSATGPLIEPSSGRLTFEPWRPSTWPPAPRRVDKNFIAALERIFRESMLDEIGNVIDDATATNGNLEHRGHVVAISLMCALDAISAYGYRGTAGWRNGKHIEDFVKRHYPKPYRRFGRDICRYYRNSLVHSWNLFEVAILPGNQPVRKAAGLSFGLLNFHRALESATGHFLKKLKTDPRLQQKTLARYCSLKCTARP